MMSQEALPEDIGEYLRNLSDQLETAPSEEIAQRARAAIAELEPEQQAALAQLLADLLRRLEEIANHVKPPDH